MSLHSHAAKGKADKVRSILEREPELLDSVNKAGKTALILAADANEPEVVDVLLSFHADVNIVDKDGYTALMYASEAGADSIALKVRFICPPCCAQSCR